jgi:hypothetical protein
MQSQEWTATFSNWTVSGPPSTIQLLVPGPGSQWIGCTDSRCTFAGAWNLRDGFYLGGQSAACGSTTVVTVSYYSGYRHDVWLATEFNTQGGQISAVLDGGTPAASLNTLGSGDAVTARRNLFTQVAPGQHSVTITVGSGTLVFDHLLISVPTTDTPSLAPQTDLSAAFDYSTDHTYKLPPARILWLLSKLGLQGPVNQYIGVFWWNQRIAAGAVTGEADVTFSGTFQSGDQISLNIGGQICGKSVFPADTLATIAQHFADFINTIYVGVWAETSGAVLKIHNRSADPAYSYPLTPTLQLTAGSTGSASIAGSLLTGTPATWVIDPTQDPPINAGARAWHSDFYASCAAAGLEVTTSCSMELVNPPAGYAAQFADGTAVLTDSDFANLQSTQCSFSAEMQTYQIRVYTWLAQTMAAAGLSPVLQCGEFVWWYFSEPAPSADFAFYAAGNGHSHFITVNGTTYSYVENNPNGDSSAAIAQALMKAVNSAPDPWVVASIGSQPYVVQLTPSHASTSPIAISSDNGSATLHYSGGMAYYDAETSAAAQTALGRPLAQFLTPADNPQINGGADATFLRNRLRDYCTAITSAVKAAVPGTKFEILFPDDVNFPTPAGVHSLGGQLNRFVNLPPEWSQPGGSGFDRFKLEDLDFGAWSRDLDLVYQCQQLPLQLGWPMNLVSCITPVFAPGYAWPKEVASARALLYRAITLWAFDHVNLYGLDVTPPNAKRSFLMA